MNTYEDIAQIIDEENVEFIRLQFSDIFGNLKNIAVTPGQLERVAKNQYTLNSTAMFGGLVEYGEELFLYPDLDTFIILPWRSQGGKVAKFICDVCYEDGTPFEMAPRTILKKVLEEAKKEGYYFNVNTECEFFLFHIDDHGNPTTISHENAGYLDVGPVDFGENARRELVLTLDEMGFEVESSHHEKAPAQHEIDFTQGEALETADALVTFKFAVRSIAKRFGLYATFMPKPKFGEAGSGMHLNFSMYKDGKNLFNPENGEKLSEIAQHFTAGILYHAEGMCAITNPIVNSYKRILTGFKKPAIISWSRKHDKSVVKVRKFFGETMVDIRFPDPAADPYLSIAICIAAGLDGIRQKMPLLEEGAKTGKQLPGNLKDALRHFKKDKYICEVLGEEFSKLYLQLKTEEWDEYMLQVSDWEISRYLNKM
ncbi:MAG: glutamine synthetase family protein [Eubacteriales bacterium]|nr:glutamine synthetase family protein [Eubacteriales bacterium]